MLLSALYCSTCERWKESYIVSRIFHFSFSVLFRWFYLWVFSKRFQFESIFRRKNIYIENKMISNFESILLFLIHSNIEILLRAMWVCVIRCCKYLLICVCVVCICLLWPNGKTKKEFSLWTYTQRAFVCVACVQWSRILRNTNEAGFSFTRKSICISFNCSPYVGPNPYNYIIDANRMNETVIPPRITSLRSKLNQFYPFFLYVEMDTFRRLSIALSHQTHPRESVFPIHFHLFRIQNNRLLC